MKILMVRMWPYPLNIKNYNCQETGLAKALVKKGHQCDIVISTNEKPHTETIKAENGTPITIYYLNTKNIIKNAFYSNQLFSLIKNYDVVQTSEYDQIGNVLLKKKMNGRMVIYHGPYSCDFTKGYKIKCLLADMCYLLNKGYKSTPCLSKSLLATELLKKKGFTNITTVGVGLDTKRFESTAEKSEVISDLEAQKERDNLKFLLYIGKLEKRRSTLTLIETLKRVSEREPNARLLIIGKGTEKYEKKCFDYAKELGVLDKITHIRSIPNEQVQFALKLADAFLLPTRYEIFGMVLLEAMYFGTPVITTKNGGSVTLIKNNENGIVLDNLSSNEWANAVLSVINNYELREKISQNAQSTIRDNFTWDKLADKFISVYGSVL